MRQTFTTRSAGSFTRRTALAFALALGAAAAGLSAAPAARAQALTPPEELVEKARLTVMRVSREEELRYTVPNLLRRAKAVVIFPSLLKGAFFIGGEGGSGVLLTRDANGNWSHPAFYTMGSVSFGLQLGGQSSEALLIVMTDGGLQSIMKHQAKLGGDISAAVGPIGVGASADTTTALGADIYTYSMNQGLFLGASLEGAVVARRDDWNESFYGPGASVQAIVIDRRFGNQKADPLRQALMELTGSGMGQGTPLSPAQGQAPVQQNYGQQNYNQPAGQPSRDIEAQPLAPLNSGPQPLTVDRTR